MNYLRGTVLRPLLRALPDTRFTMRLDWDRGQCQRVARQVEQIASIGVRERPTYVFTHFIVPHEPFVFAPDGRCLSRRSPSRGAARTGYVEQVAYVRRLIEQLVTALQAEGRPRPIILIQADEGRFPRTARFPIATAASRGRTPPRSSSGSSSASSTPSTSPAATMASSGPTSRW